MFSGCFLFFIDSIVTNKASELPPLIFPKALSLSFLHNQRCTPLSSFPN